MLELEHDGAGGRGVERAVGERNVCARHVVEIGGVSPVLGPWQGEPNIDEARARPGSDRAARWWLLALVGFREGGSEGSRRCVVVANESEAP
jgi:hypothetical protein